MNIQGFQKLTLLDYPGKMACTLFTAGCNMRCPFCHNADLLLVKVDYEKYLENAIKFISEIDILAEGGIIVAELPLGKEMTEEFHGLIPSKDYRYGNTVIRLYRKADPAESI